MKRFASLILFLALVSPGLSAQASTTAQFIQFGSVLPATCAPTAGQLFSLITGVSVTLYGCTATNVWTPATGGIAPLTLWFNHPITPFTLPTTTATLSVTNNGTTATITRSLGDFTADGWSAGMLFTASGFSNSANNQNWVIRTAVALTLTLQSMAATGCTVGAGCTPAVLAMVAEGPTLAVTLQADREGLTATPPTGVQVDDLMRIDTGDGGIPIDSYVTDSGVPNATAIPVGLWQFRDFAYRTAGGNNTTEYFQVLKVNAAGVTTVLFDTSATATTITAANASPPQQIDQTYTISSPIALATTDRIIVRPTFTANALKVVHHVYQGTSYTGYIITSFSR